MSTSLPSRTAVFVLAVAGLIVCWNMLNVKSPVRDSGWLCGGDDSGTYGCAGIFASRYGKVRGVPTAALGVAYFFTIALWTVVFGKRTFNVLFALLLAGGVIVSLTLLYILYVVLPGQCRWCLAAHLINLALVAVVCITWRRTRRRAPTLPGRTLAARACIVALVVLAAAGWAAAYVAAGHLADYKHAYTAMRTNPEFQRWLYHAQPSRDIPITDRDHVLGSADAVVKIVVYKDFQCDHCADGWKTLHTLYRRKYADTGRVALIVRHWPLSSRCNDAPHLGNAHPYACAAAYAAEAVAAVAGNDAFWTYHNRLVENHDRLDRSPYADLARQLGIDPTAFHHAWRSDQVRDNVRADVEAAKQLNLRAVPAIFINGRYVADAWRVDGLLEELIDAEIPQPHTR